MIDLDILFRQLELISRERCDNFTLSVGDTHELITRLRQAEKDAARYRWLRDCNWDLSVACVVADPKKSVKLGCDCPSGDRLDTLVDAHL